MFKEDADARNKYQELNNGISELKRLSQIIISFEKSRDRLGSSLTVKEVRDISKEVFDIVSTIENYGQTGFFEADFYIKKLKDSIPSIKITAVGYQALPELDAFDASATLKAKVEDLLSQVNFPNEYKNLS